MMADAKSRWRDVLLKISGRAINSMKLAGIVLNKRLENRLSKPVSEGAKALDSNDRRKTRRLSMEKDIMFRYANGKPALGHIINISKRGMYIITDATLNDGEEINANLLWKNLGSLTNLEGHIVRRGDNGFAVRFI
jgi:hypothetical protein